MTWMTIYHDVYLCAMNRKASGDDDSDEEIGALIYQSSRTAKAIAKVEKMTPVAPAMSKRDAPHKPNGPAPTKRVRRECSIADCTKWSNHGGRHGAKHKTCTFEGCTNNAVKGGVCIRHGAKRKTCSREGCTNNAVKGGVCVRHGAKQKTCTFEGCANNAKKGGICIRHGAKRSRKKCSDEGCTKTMP